MRTLNLMATLLVGASAGTSFAVPVFLNNPSFEDDGPGIPSWATSTTQAIPETTVLAGHFVPLPETYASVPDGAQIAYLFNGYARMAQTTSVKLSAGRVYEFSAYLGHRPDQGQPRTWISLLPESKLASFLADPISGSPYLALTQAEAETIPAGTFVKYSVTFDTNSPANAELMSLYAGEKMVVAVTAVTDGQVNVDAASFNYIPAGPTYWNINSSGDWNSDLNWGEGIPAAGESANFLGAITSPQTVYTNAPVTVGSLNFDNANSYQIAGHGSLTLQVSSGNASVGVAQGSHTLNLRTYFASDTTLTVAGGATLTLSDPVVIRAGKTVTRNGDVVIESPLTIEAGGAYNLGTGPAAVVFGAPSLGSGAKVNVGTNSLVIDYRGQASPAATVKTQLFSGRNGGAWDGEGISTTAATASTGLGWVDSPSTQSLLVKYTYNGDANLDGSVDSNDFNVFVSAYGATSGAIWAQGDFDYDGRINTQDFNALAGNFGQTMSAPSLGSVVPEPAGLLVAVLSLGSLAARARRRVR